MEKVEIDHPFHEHPLILSENADNEESVGCYGCGDPIGSREWAYVCVREKQCHSTSGIIFHRRCGELPTPISHTSHPHHLLHLVDFHRVKYHQCNLCKHYLYGEFGYRCSRCDFDMDLKCERLGRNELLGDSRQLQHPCHLHPLMLMRKPPFVFNCDGCGTEDRDMAYTCSTCDLMIHKACALLPPLLPTNHHHHQLSLTSRFPFHHRNFVYKCSICSKDFNLISWMYYCGDCRFFAHLRCATSEHRSYSGQEKNEDGSILIQFPLEACDIPKKLITPFIIRENGLDKMPDVNDMPPSITMSTTKESYSLSFNYHMHSLSLVSELSHQGDDNDDDNDVKMKICDLCVKPISSLPFYECAPCNYFVHSVCSLLPKTLSSLESQLYGDCPRTGKNHNFTLSTDSKRMESSSFFMCYICAIWTNGMVYGCEECRTK